MFEGLTDAQVEQRAQELAEIHLAECEDQLYRDDNSDQLHSYVQDPEDDADSCVHRYQLGEQGYGVTICGEPQDHPLHGPVDVESAGPYCGCPTCIVREVLHAAWPAVLELARREQR